jgi:hypothetical protein
MSTLLANLNASASTVSSKQAVRQFKRFSKRQAVVGIRNGAEITVKM